MRPVLTFLQKVVGNDHLSLIVNLVIGFMLISALFYIFKSRSRGYMKPALAFAVLFLGGVVAMGYEIPAERIHFLEYGILGVLLYKAMISDWNAPVFSSFVLITVIGSGDETIQWFLPNRVGDLRDVFMNCIGGSIGIVVTMLLRNKY